MVMAEKEIKWTAPEFEYHHKGVSWHWLLVITAGLIILIALWQKNFLFAVFVAIAATLMVKWGHHEPRYVNFRLTGEGLEFDTAKYPYEDFAGFATHPVHGQSEDLSYLIFQRKHRLGTYLKVLAPTIMLEEIRILANKYLPEIEYEESLMDHLSRFLKF